MAVETPMKTVQQTAKDISTEGSLTNGITSKDLFLPAAGDPEPQSGEHDDVEDDGDDEDDAPITPPESEAKGPAASKKAAPVKNTSTKANAAPGKEAPAKSSPNGAKKFVGNVKAAKNNEQQIHSKGGKKSALPKDTKVTSQVDNSTQQQAPVGGASTKLEVKSGIVMDPAVFSTQIFDIFVSASKTHYMAHEAILVQSPLLKRLIQSQSNKKGKQKQTLVLPRESAANFGTLLQYLYSHQLLMPSLSGNGDLSGDTDGEDAKVAARTLAKLYVLAHNYEMEGMQERITSVLETTNLMEKIPGLEFFQLAEKLYPVDADDAEEDEFARHFKKVAPDLIRTVPDDDLQELMRMVSAGGAYAEAIFSAYNIAVRNSIGLDATAVRVKREHEDEAGNGGESTKRARTGSADGGGNQ